MPLSFSPVVFSLSGRGESRNCQLTNSNVAANRRRRAVTPRTLASSIAADQAGKYRDKNHHDDDYFDVLVDSGDAVAEKISQPHHAPDPDDRADDVKGDELSESHSPNARYYRCERPDHRHELG